jgi:hypothetical protein
VARECEVALIGLNVEETKIRQCIEQRPIEKNNLVSVEGGFMFGLHLHDAPLHCWFV